MSEDRTDPPLDPFDPLGPLTTTPVPLVGADQVRARGRQRARRSQALLAGTGVLLVAALAGGAALLVGGPAEQSLLVPGDTLSTGPSVDPDPDPCGTPTPISVPSGSSCQAGPDGNGALRPVEPGPSDGPTPSASPPAPPAGSVEELPGDTLVIPAGLDQAFPGRYSWVRTSSSRSLDDYGWDPCGTGEPAKDGRVQAVSGRYDTFESNGTEVPEGPAFVESVHRFETAEQAATVAADYRSLVSSCPVVTFISAPDGQNADGQPPTVASRNEVLSPSPFVVAEFPTVGSSDANGEPAFSPWPRYYGVTVVGNVLAVWDYFPGETTDDQGADRIAELVDEGLCRTAGTC